MEKFFKVKEHGSTVKTEVLAGITTFMAMAYILMVNANMFSELGVVSYNAIYIATAISAVVGTFLIAFLANLPLGLASGMGLNAFFVYTVCFTFGLSYANALILVLLDGVVFIILTLTGVRKMLFDAIPQCVRMAISAGIGLFIAIIALLNANVVVASESTTVALGELSSPTVVLSLVGLLIIGALQHYKVPGGILLGILITWVLGIMAQLVGWYVPNPEAGVYSVIPQFSLSSFEAPKMFQFDFGFIAKNVPAFILIVFTFLYTDIFDTVGTLIGVAEKGKLLDKDGSLPNATGALMADAVGTVVGACLGTSTVTSYVESSAGVAAGGRTGLTAVTTAVLFFISLIFAPIFTSIPSFATTPAMLYVGLLMLSSIRQVKFDGDIADAIGAFLAIIMMPLTYSIANGIMFGIVSWVILKLVTGKAKDISAVMHLRDSFTD